MELVVQTPPLVQGSTELSQGSTENTDKLKSENRRDLGDCCASSVPESEQRNPETLSRSCFSNVNLVSGWGGAT